METKKIQLTKSQKEIMKNFYQTKPTQTVLLKSEYKNIWKKLRNSEVIQNIKDINSKCPAIICEIEKSKINNKNLQSAVFSECVYAQTLANIFKLTEFYNYSFDSSILTKELIGLLKSYFLSPRYVYTNIDKSHILIQAGGCDGVDSALIQVLDNSVFSIEFKEQFSRATSADLPKYDEDGVLKITKQFLEKYPWYKDMINEHKTLNIFEMAGQNITDFSKESIRKAVVNSYRTTKKFADVIVTVDKNEDLTMLPANQVDVWAKLKGELRAARNKSRVWTPNKLKEIITEIGGKLYDNKIIISKDKITIAKARGNTNESRYKITPIFFVYTSDCSEENNDIVFNIQNVWQLKPVITAIMHFHNLHIENVKSYYNEDMK